MLRIRLLVASEYLNVQVRLNAEIPGERVLRQKRCGNIAKALGNRMVTAALGSVPRRVVGREDELLLPRQVRRCLESERTGPAIPNQFS